MGKMQRRKGGAYERLIAGRLREVYPHACRGLGQARAGGEVADVDGVPWWPQLKHGRRPNVLAALEQAERDHAAARRKPGPPIAIVRRNGEEDVVALRFGDWVALLRASTAYQNVVDACNAANSRCFCGQHRSSPLMDLEGEENE